MFISIYRKYLHYFERPCSHGMAKKTWRHERIILCICDQQVSFGQIMFSAPPTKFFPYADGCIRNTPQQTLLLRLMAKSTTQNAKRLTKHKRNRKQTNCKNRINRTDFSGSALHRWKSMMKGIISSLSLFLSEKTWHSIFVKVGSLESGLRVVPKDCRDCKRMREESQVPFSSRDSKEWSARFFNPLSSAMLLRPLPAFSRAQYKWRNWHVRYQSQF